MQSDEALAQLGPALASSVACSEICTGAVGVGSAQQSPATALREVFLGLFFAVTCRIVQTINIRRVFFPLSLSVEL